MILIQSKGQYLNILSIYKVARNCVQTALNYAKLAKGRYINLLWTDGYIFYLLKK